MTLKSMIFTLIMCVTALVQTQDANNQAEQNYGATNKVATISPISHSMAQAMLLETNIEVQYLPSQRLPVNRIGSWITRNRNQPQPAVDALITIASLREELNFYTSLRQSNIRVVPIDIATALLPEGERVAVEQASEYFWLNPNNAIMMLGILKRDLSALYPQHAQQIRQNYQVLSSELRTLSLMIDEWLLTNGIEGITLEHQRLAPLANSLMLPTLTATQGFTTIEITRKEGAWQVDDFSKYSELSFLQRWQNNLPRGDY